MPEAPAAPGPPPLRPFGLVLHHDGGWTHEGIPIANARLRSAFDRGVRFLPAESVFVVQLGRYRGQIEIEEAGFFVRSFDPATGLVAHWGFEDLGTSGAMSMETAIAFCPL